jgi:hypothetical protein
MKIVLFINRVDRICAQMNAGLTATAIVLAVMVGSMSVIRASEVAADLAGVTLGSYAAISSDQPAFNFWTYD